MGCPACLARCLAGLPWASLAAALLSLAGVALLCGCGLAGLAGASGLLDQHFARPGDLEPLAHALQVLRYVLLGVAAGFLLHGAVLLAAGVVSTGAARGRAFRPSACGRCLGATFVLVTFVLGVAWLGVFGASAVPVFLLHSVRRSCEAAGSSPGNGSAGADGVCVDVRQFGLVPWDADPGRLCGSALDGVCGSSEFHVTFRLFVAAWAGAGATAVGLLVYIMASTYNYAVLRFRSQDACCTKF